jgi:hypothetical protein
LQASSRRAMQSASRRSGNIIKIYERQYEHFAKRPA